MKELDLTNSNSTALFLRCVEFQLFMVTPDMFDFTLLVPFRTLSSTPRPSLAPRSRWWFDLLNKTSYILHSGFHRITTQLPKLVMHVLWCASVPTCLPNIHSYYPDGYSHRSINRKTDEKVNSFYNHRKQGLHFLLYVSKFMSGREAGHLSTYISPSY